MRPLLPVLAVALLLALPAAAAAAPGPGEIGPASGQTQNGRVLTPAGRLTTLGNFPTGGALSPDGRFYWAANAGHGRNSISVVEIATGAVSQTLPLPGAYVGVAFAPDGKTAYVSGAAKGDPDPGAPVKGGAGDEIHTFSVDAAGKATETDLIPLAPPQGGRARTTDTLFPTQKAYPEGLDVSPDGATLVVALNQADRVAIVDTKTRAARYVSVGNYPYSAQVDRDSKRAFVTNELSGTVSVVDLAAGSVSATIPVGGPAGDPKLGGPLGDFNAHPQGMALDPKRDLLYVAVANRDLVGVVDTKTLKTVRYVSVARPAALGTAPVALAVTPDGSSLFVADANEDALAVVALTERVVPAIPARPAQPGRAGTGGTPAPSALTVFAPRSTASILRYRTSRVTAQRAYRASLRKARTAAARSAAKRRYTRTLTSLRTRLFEGEREKACAGPSAAADRGYRTAVLKAAQKRDAALRRAKGSGRSAKRRRAAARRAFARTAAGARRQLPERKACSPGAGGTPGAGGNPGSPGFPARTVAAFTLLGRIPTAAYPQDVRVTADGKRLVWLAAKGLGAGPNPGQPTTAGGGVGTQPAQPPQGDDNVLNKLIGRAGVLDLPSDAEIAGPLNAAADRQVLPANAQAPPAGTPVHDATGGASTKIKHVFYIVKENRTYDQVLGKGSGGTGPQGQGRAELEAFGDNDPDGTAEPGEGVTPNLHALARRFGLLDHVYANSEVSIDGHIITSGGYATDYNQKSTAQNYSSRGRAFDFGLFNVALPPNFSVFDQAERQGVPYRFYGEASAGTFAGNAGRQNESGSRPTGDAVQTKQDATYPNQSVYGCVSGAACFYDSGRQGSTNTVPPLGFNPATSRFEVFKANFALQVATDSLPRFNYLTVPNDHTNGASSGSNTPSALVADNDLAVGQLVDLISHSPIWGQSAIFVIEDDSQAGADSVDAHRMPGLVVSPWAKGGLTTTRYDQYSFLRTAMSIAGLKPLSLNDALATPLYDVFANGDTPPNPAPYDAVQPQQSIGQRNGAPATPVAGSIARLSDALPYERQDVVPQTITDRILWQSVYGSTRPTPGPGPNASALEIERANEVMEVYREGGDVDAWIKGHPGEEAEGR
jgi:YVTN family beta-propeller protein